MIDFEGDIDGSIIEKECLLDKQYADIARRAVLLKPNELQLAPAAFIRFQKKFKINWTDAIDDNSVFNAVDAAVALGVSYSVLNDAWLVCINDGNMVKFSRGCYCGYLNSIPGVPPIYCINGFYMHMRAQFIAPGASIHYFSVRWENDLMTWEAFRRRIIGSSNPSMAQSGSLRSIIALEWRELNLANEPNMENNGIHASASAFEAFVERAIWLNETSFADDPFASNLLDAGIPEKYLEEWSLNSTVAQKSVFDHMENKGTEECISTAVELYQEFSESPLPDAKSPITPVGSNIHELPLGHSKELGATMNAPISQISRADTAGLKRLPPLVADKSATQLPSRLTPLQSLNMSTPLISRTSLTVTTSAHRISSPIPLRRDDNQKLIHRTPTSTPQLSRPMSGEVQHGLSEALSTPVRRSDAQGVFNVSYHVNSASSSMIATPDMPRRYETPEDRRGRSVAKNLSSDAYHNSSRDRHRERSSDGNSDGWGNERREREHHTGRSASREHRERMSRGQEEERYRHRQRSRDRHSSEGNRRNHSRERSRERGSVRRSAERHRDDYRIDEGGYREDRDEDDDGDRVLSI